MPDEIHRKLKQRAAEDGMTLSHPLAAPIPHPNPHLNPPSVAGFR